ncbi:MAG: hypothetical protein U0231_16380 [Nitrospiraceae bacterium]
MASSSPDGFRRGDVDGGRDHVIARLSQVHMVIGMDELAASRTAQQLGSPVGNDFVGIHVRGGAGAGLKNIHRKLGVRQPSVAPLRSEWHAMLSNNFVSG